MWEDEELKNKRTKIILFLLIIVIAGALLAAMYFVRNKTQQEDEVLAQSQQVQAAEQTEARAQALKDIDALYQQDLDALAEYMPGIVCWGDTLTTGTSGNISYPFVLEKYIQANITDIYTFSDSVPNASDYSYIDYSKYKVSIPVINMGAGDENARTVMARAGALQFVTSHTFTIPAECEKVRVSIASSENQKTVNPLVGGDGGINKVTIDGIEGTLSLVSSEYTGYSVGQYYFQRSEPGSEKEIPSGTVIKTSSEDLYKNYIHVIWIGNYGGYDSTSDLVEKVKTFIDRQEINKDRYIVLGLFNNWSDSYDKPFKQEFGSNYISVWNYLMTDGITDANLTLSSKDKNYVASGYIPSAFRGTNGSNQLNSTAYRLIGKLVYDRMNSLGFFKEIEDELYIKETEKLLLKDNPEYLDNLLQSRLKEIGDK